MKNPDHSAQDKRWKDLIKANRLRLINSKEFAPNISDDSNFKIGLLIATILTFSVDGENETYMITHWHKHCIFDNYKLSSNNKKVENISIKTLRKIFNHVSELPEENAEEAPVQKNEEGLALMFIRNDMINRKLLQL